MAPNSIFQQPVRGLIIFLKMLLQKLFPLEKGPVEKILGFLMVMPLAKGSDCIRLVFAHPSPLNSGAPIASANFISDGKVQVCPYGVASSNTLIMELAQLMGAPLFKTNGWAQSNCFSSQTLSNIICLIIAWSKTVVISKFVVAWFEGYPYTSKLIQGVVYLTRV